MKTENEDAQAEAAEEARKAKFTEAMERLEAEVAAHEPPQAGMPKDLDPDFTFDPREASGFEINPIGTAAICGHPVGPQLCGRKVDAEGRHPGPHVADGPTGQVMWFNADPAGEAPAELIGHPSTADPVVAAEIVRLRNIVSDLQTEVERLHRGEVVPLPARLRGDLIRFLDRQERRAISRDTEKLARGLKERVKAEGPDDPQGMDRETALWAERVNAASCAIYNIEDWAAEGGVITVERIEDLVNRILPNAAGTVTHHGTPENTFTTSTIGSRLRAKGLA